MAFCELALKASDSSVHPGMNERSRWFDDDRDLVVVLVAEPMERHGRDCDRPQYRRNGTLFLPQFPGGIWGCIEMP
jgi:hypothetical protein